MYKTIKVTAKNAKEAKALLASINEEPRANAPYPKSRAKSARWLWGLVGWLAGNRRLQNQNTRLRAEVSELRRTLDGTRQTLKSVRDQNDRLLRCAHYAEEALHGRHPKLGA